MKRGPRLLWVSVLALMLTSCQKSALGLKVEEHGDRREVALTPVDLLVHAQIHDGKEVVVVGWMESGFERHRLWDSESAYANGHSEDLCIGLSVPVGMGTDSMDKAWVTIRGRFVGALPDNVIATGRCNNRTSIYVTERPMERTESSRKKGAEDTRVAGD